MTHFYAHSLVVQHTSQFEFHFLLGGVSLHIFMNGGELKFLGEIKKRKKKLLLLFYNV